MAFWVHRPQTWTRTILKTFMGPHLLLGILVFFSSKTGWLHKQIHTHVHAHIYTHMHIQSCFHFTQGPQQLKNILINEKWKRNELAMHPGSRYKWSQRRARSNYLNNNRNKEVMAIWRTVVGGQRWRQRKGCRSHNLLEKGTPEISNATTLFSLITVYNCGLSQASRSSMVIWCDV